MAAETPLTPAWKRGADLILGLMALVVAAAPMAAIAILIRVDSPGPAMIHQRRIGQHGREYRMYKFRTLPANTPQMSKEMMRQERIRPTRLGSLLRRYSLDELPQLINVVLGNMSLVGPRPALYTQNDLIEMRARSGVLRVKPGITGLAQVSGREDLELTEKVRLDAEYVSQLSPWLDLTIARRTISAVLRARGSY
jgi:O-antigen biosynthesis protein WbqP